MDLKVKFKYRLFSFMLQLALSIIYEYKTSLKDIFFTQSIAENYHFM